MVSKGVSVGPKHEGGEAMTRNRFNTFSLLVFGIVVAAFTVIVQAQQSDDILLFDQPVDHDVYGASSTVHVQASIDGDFVSAGQRVTVDADVAGDVTVAAQDIEIRAEIGDDVRVAGQRIRIASPVLGHIVAAGQSVTIEQPVGDWAWLAGTTVNVLGDVGGDLKIRASEITIDAEVSGDVELIGDQLDLGPAAVIRGNVTWRSHNEASISANAQIDGEFINEPPPGFVDELSSAETYSLPLKLIAAVFVLYLLFSRPLRTTLDRIATRPGGSAAIGLAVFLVTPFVAVLLLFTGVGVWLGLAMILAFLLMLLLGVLTGLFAVSDMVLRKFVPEPAVWHSLAAIFATVVMVALLAKIPWVGFIGIMAIWFLGLGALCWILWEALRRLRQQEPATS